MTTIATSSNKITVIIPLRTQTHILDFIHHPRDSSSGPWWKGDPHRGCGETVLNVLRNSRWVSNTAGFWGLFDFYVCIDLEDLDIRGSIFSMEWQRALKPVEPHLLMAGSASLLVPELRKRRGSYGNPHHGHSGSSRVLASGDGRGVSPGCVKGNLKHSEHVHV